MYNYQCQHCGANLDPEEKCDCVSELRQKKAAELKAMQSRKTKEDKETTLRNSARLQIEFSQKAQEILQRVFKQSDSKTPHF